jgi:hypothetical protein
VPLGRWFWLLISTYLLLKVIIFTTYITSKHETNMYDESGDEEETSYAEFERARDSRYPTSAVSPPYTPSRRRGTCSRSRAEL